MKFMSNAKKIVAGLLVAVTLVGSPLAVYAGYAPSNRPTYQCITPTNCPGADHVVFNSFTNAPNYGDERAFFDGKDATNTSPGGYLDNISVKDGQKLVLRVYIHNNANPGLIGEAAATAKNTRMQVMLPITKKTSNFAAASVAADNANPVTVSDTVDFTGAAPFTVKFDQSTPVQITYRPNGTGDFVTRNLPVASFANDNLLNANFGDWKGCFEYGALVTMTVIVKMDQQPPEPAYSCDVFDIKAEAGRKVTATTFNTSAINGAVFKNADINWGDGSAATTTTNVEGQTHQYSKDGTYTINTTARFTVDGQEVTATSVACSKQVTFKDDQPPKVTPPTTPAAPTKLVNTGAGETLGLFAIVTAAGAFLYRRMLTRSFDQ
jgi:hypothetical protein